MTVLEDRGSAWFHLGIAAAASALAVAFWSGAVDTDGLLSARLSSDAPRFVMAIGAIVLLSKVPWAVRVLVRPRAVMEIDGDRVSFDGQVLDGHVVARVPDGVFGERGTQEFGPVDVFCDGQKVTRLASTRPHRAADLVARLNGLGGGR